MKAFDATSHFSLARTSVALALTMLLFGCPTPLFQGVSRTAKLDSMPSLSCVRSTIETTRGVSSVQFEEEIATEYGQKYFFVYRGPADSDVAATLQLLEKRNGEVFLFQTSHSGAQQRDIDATRPVMKSIENRLASECGMRSLPGRVEETCRGVLCN
jgi:uncharacterized protein YceH (UPF0502 family)